MKKNAICFTDGYKVTHWKQYRDGITGSFSFFGSRGGEFPDTVFFGLQYYLKEYFAGSVISDEKITHARRRFKDYFGTDAYFNEDGWRNIVDRHSGRLPLLIKAVPEGTIVPAGNALLTVESTDPDFFWGPSYVEPPLSMLWYPCTVARRSYASRMLIRGYLERTGDPSLLDFKLHDFGLRGSTSFESSGIGDMAHLLSFKGTDTLPGIEFAEEYYGEQSAGFSVAAAEHSTITSHGRGNEKEAYEKILKEFPTGVVAVVSDSYDIFHACSEIWGGELKDRVLERDGVLVVRPDSGYPPDVVLRVLDILGEKFGYGFNGKGYKKLNPKVGVIQGDGVNYGMKDTILGRMAMEKWSADNVAFGSGGALLQDMNRDTQKFAYKCSAVHADGVWEGVMKDPITDPGKRSMPGRLKLIIKDGKYKTVQEHEEPDCPNLLVPVFKDGVILKEYSFQDIRKRLLGS